MTGIAHPGVHPLLPRFVASVPPFGLHQLDPVPPLVRRVGLTDRPAHAGLQLAAVLGSTAIHLGKHGERLEECIERPEECIERLAQRASRSTLLNAIYITFFIAVRGRLIVFGVWGALADA